MTTYEIRCKLMDSPEEYGWNFRDDCWYRLATTQDCTGATCADLDEAIHAVRWIEARPALMENVKSIYILRWDGELDDDGEVADSKSTKLFLAPKH
jgi:hypothetical protein